MTMIEIDTDDEKERRATWLADLLDRLQAYDGLQAAAEDAAAIAEQAGRHARDIIERGDSMAIDDLTESVAVLMELDGHIVRHFTKPMLKPVEAEPADHGSQESILRH